MYVGVSQLEFTMDSDRIIQGNLLAESSSQPRIIMETDHAGFSREGNHQEISGRCGLGRGRHGKALGKALDCLDDAKAGGELVAGENDSLGVLVNALSGTVVGPPSAAR
jgi:hypothetical protein